VKTIIDAVNDLKCSLSDVVGAGLHIWFFDGDYELADFRGRQGGGVRLNTESWRYVCSLIDFQSLVSELSHATWIKGAPLAEYQTADKEALKVESKTVEHNGVVVEIGKLYLFSDKNGDSEIGELSYAGDVNDGNGFMYQSKVSLRNSNKYEWWHSISAIKSAIGTITHATIKLVDGAAYAFEYQDEDMLGRYHAGTNRFIIGNSNVKAGKVKNITRLVPEVK